MTPRQQSQVAKLLSKYFNLTELNHLMFDLNIRAESIPGITFEVKALELVTYCNRHGRFEEFRKLVVRKRPNTLIEKEIEEILHKPRTANPPLSSSGSVNTEKEDRRTAIWLALGLLILAIVAIALMQLWPPFNYVIRVQNSNTSSYIEGAKVTLEVSDLPPLIKYSDTEGVAILQIDSDREGQVGKIVVSANGYKNYTRNLEIRSRELPTLFRLEPENSSQESVAVIESDNQDIELPNQVTATPTPSRKPNTPTPTATLTESTATATAAIISTSTPTTTGTPTSTPTETSTQSLYQVDLPSSDWVNIYTQPSNVTGSPRAQVAGGDVIEKLEQNEDGSWYRVRIVKNDIEGWINSDVLVLIEATITPAPTHTSTPSSVTPPTACLTVSIEHEPLPSRDFDTITLRYSDWPSETVDFAFEVYTVPQGGGKAYLVDPTTTDTGTAFYEIAYTVFENRGFAPHTTFIYDFQPRSADGQVLCTKMGTFVNP